ncbi:MAG: hypothetical protein KGJ58_04740 [Patescibacteria group bacterium]|nr:hypothetical protein [Patescibacteria group bacterium]
METIIKGQNYNFRPVANGTEFYIEALHRASLRFSFINNLNAILSEFDIGIDDEKSSESQWRASKKQGKLFFEKAMNFLSDKAHRNYLEKRLDEDRECGEWENFQHAKTRRSMVPE